MPRIRRFAIVAVLALAAGSALVGCGNNQPGTAAYVGGTRYTERHVDHLIDEIGKSNPETRPARARETLVSYLVLGDLARRVASDRSLTAPPADYASFARGLGLPADSPLVRMRAEFSAVAVALTGGVDPVNPTDADLRQLYNEIRLDPNQPEDLSYEEVAESLRTNASLPAVLGIRNALREKAAAVGVEVNPRYQPLTANLGNTELPLILIVGDPYSAVTDLPRA
jgi:hypothetical protein